MRYIIAVLNTVLIALLLAGSVYWRRAYNDKPFVIAPSKTEYIGTGVLRYNQAEAFHLLIGYDAENCIIEGPSDHNVVAYGYFYANEHAKMPYMLRFAAPPAAPVAEGKER